MTSQKYYFDFNNELTFDNIKNFKNLKNNNDNKVCSYLNREILTYNLNNPDNFIINKVDNNFTYNPN